MRLIKPKVEILDKLNGQAILKRIEQVARTCYKSEDKITDSSAEILVSNLLKLKHEAMLEFIDITVKFTCSRSVSHELVRHRLASFAQESQRYCNYSKGKFNNEVTFIIPSWLELKEGSYDFIGSEGTWYDKNTKEVLLKVFNESGEYINSKEDAFLSLIDDIESCYLGLLKTGITPQEAREILPNTTKTEVCMKANLREWRHFLELRCSTKAHPDMRTLALDLLKQLHEQVPIIFDDLYEQYYGQKE